MLRCLIEDGGGDDGSLPVIRVDDQEFSWDEFGRMFRTYAEDDEVGLPQSRIGVHPVLNEPQIQAGCQHLLLCRLAIEMLSLIALDRVGDDPGLVSEHRQVS